MEQIRIKKNWTQQKEEQHDTTKQKKGNNDMPHTLKETHHNWDTQLRKQQTRKHEWKTWIVKEQHMQKETHEEDNHGKSTIGKH